MGHTSHYCFITVEEGDTVPPNNTNLPPGRLVIVGSKGNTWAALDRPKLVYFCPFENISGLFCGFNSNLMLTFWSNGKVNTFQIAWWAQTRFPMAMHKNGYFEWVHDTGEDVALIQAPVRFRARINLVCHLFICWLQSSFVWPECGQAVFT